jgi:hypothetical protein
VLHLRLGLIRGLLDEALRQIANGAARADINDDEDRNRDQENQDQQDEQQSAADAERFRESQIVGPINWDFPDDSSQPPKTVARSSIDRKRGDSSPFGDRAAESLLSTPLRTFARDRPPISPAVRKTVREHHFPGRRC